MFRPFVQRFVFFFTRNNGKVAVKARLRSEKAQRHQLYRDCHDRGIEGHIRPVRSPHFSRNGMVTETRQNPCSIYAAG